MDERKPAQRKAYHKPRLSRVDLIEDEVALASCKASFVAAHATPNAGVNKCKVTCMKIGS